MRSWESLRGGPELGDRELAKLRQGRSTRQHRERGASCRCVRLSQMQPDATPRGAITGLPLENQGGVLGKSI